MPRTETFQKREFSKFEIPTKKRARALPQIDGEILLKHFEVQHTLINTLVKIVGKILLVVVKFIFDWIQGGKF